MQMFCTLLVLLAVMNRMAQFTIEQEWQHLQEVKIIFFQPTCAHNLNHFRLKRILGKETSHQDLSIDTKKCQI